MVLDITPDALADLQNIAEYTDQTWGVEQREVYLNQIFSKIDNILEAPEQNRSRNDLLQGLRVCPIAKHLIFYEVIEDTLYVLRVLHERMNVDEHFSTE